MAAKRVEIIAEPGSNVLVTKRWVEAPKSLVWEVFTRPEHLRRWWGPRNLELTVCEVDLRVGGRYRYVHRAPNGAEFGFHGEYRELSPPDRVVNTFVFEGLADAESVETTVFEERSGRTLVTTTSVYKSATMRDGHIASGMEAGMVDSYARLDELLEGLAQAA